MEKRQCEECRENGHVEGTIDMMGQGGKIMSNLG